jgi:hypothetical protein
MKSNKTLYVPMKLHSGAIRIDGMELPMTLPPRCRGILFAFETKTAARNFMGRNSKLIEIVKEVE